MCSIRNHTFRAAEPKKKSINQLSYSWNLELKHAVHEDDTSWLLTDFPSNTRKRKKKMVVAIYYFTTYQISEPAMSAIYFAICQIWKPTMI